MPKNKSYNIYLTEPLHRQLARLTEAGLSASAVARLAIRKRPANLPEGGIESCPVRTTIYVSSDDAAVLTEVAAATGISRAETLRRLIAAYLNSNSDAISALF